MISVRLCSLVKRKRLRFDTFFSEYMRTNLNYFTLLLLYKETDSDKNGGS